MSIIEIMELNLLGNKLTYIENDHYKFLLWAIMQNGLASLDIKDFLKK